MKNIENVKQIYGIIDNTTGSLYPDTHLFVLDNPVKAVYAFCVFAGKLNDTDISLCCIGDFNSDTLSVVHLSTETICNFDNVLNYLNSVDDNVIIAAGFNRKTFIHHYNIIISNINSFRNSLRSVEDE